MSVAVSGYNDRVRIPLIQLGHGQGSDMLAAGVGRESAGAGYKLAVDRPLVQVRS